MTEGLILPSKDILGPSGELLIPDRSRDDRPLTREQQAIQALEVLVPLARVMATLVTGIPPNTQDTSKDAKRQRAAWNQRRDQTLRVALEVLGTPEEKAEGRLSPIQGRWHSSHDETGQDGETDQGGEA